MNVDVNYLAVFLAALSSMVVGSVWYAKSVFGNTWGKLAKVKMDRPPKAKEMIWLLGSTFLASFVTALVLAHLAALAHNFYNNSFLSDALQTGLWAWLGFTALRFYVHDAFENRPVKLTSLNAAHELVTIEIMALVIGLLKP
jgi:hypothetical protein